VTECIKTKTLSRYYDHELSSIERLEFEYHLTACTQCREATESYTELSRLFTSDAQPELSNEAMGRIHSGLSALQHNGLRAIAKSLATAAVFLLIAGGIFASQPRGGSISQEPLGVDLVEATGLLQADETELADAETEFAEWMVVTLSQGDEDD